MSGHVTKASVTSFISVVMHRIVQDATVLISPVHKCIVHFEHAMLKH